MEIILKTHIDPKDYYTFEFIKGRSHQDYYNVDVSKQDWDKFLGASDQDGWLTIQPRMFNQTDNTHAELFHSRPIVIRYSAIIGYQYAKLS